MVSATVACVSCRKHFSGSSNLLNCRRHVEICWQLRGVDLQVLYDSGLSTPEIAEKVGVKPEQVLTRIRAYRGRGKDGVVKKLHDPPAPCQYCGRVFKNKDNRRRHEEHCRKVEGVDLQKEYDDGLSITQVSEKFGVSVKFVWGMVPRRRSREAGTKKRRAEEPERYFFGKRNGKPSRGEQVFAEMLEESGLPAKYEIIDQYHQYGYRLDFAFLGLKLDVEIDGMQHYTWESIKKRDVRRDTLLVSRGWSVYRIASVDFLKRPRVVFERFVDHLRTIADIPTRIVYDGQVIDGRKKFVDEREKLIRDSGIDFEGIGWSVALGELLGIHPGTALRWVRSNMPEFYKSNCRTPKVDFKRRGVPRNPIQRKTRTLSAAGRESLIRESGIDFSKRGWTVCLGNLLGVRSSTAGRWVASNMPDFYRDVCCTPRVKDL